MARVVLLVLLCGCKQLLGIDEAAPAGTDGPIVPTDQPVDQSIDMSAEAGTAVTVTFRNGDNGYAGTQDTIVDQNGPNQNHGADAQLSVRATDRSALIQFTQIFGNGVGQIPTGATITSATLDLAVEQINSTGTIYEVTISWTEDVSFNTFGADPGIAGDFGAAVATFAPAMSGVATFDVTATVAKWSAATLANNGWIILGEAGGADTKLRSSEDLTITNHPTLHVTYLGP